MEKEHFFAEARSDVHGPLEGIRVVEATTTWAGPMAACIFADFGADVVKVELPEGEVSRRVPPLIPGTTLSIMNETVNRNKRSATLDLRKPEGRDLFLELARGADVVIENFRPGTMAAWGLGYDDVRRVKPDVIYVSISGFGQFGPLSDRVGYDPMAQATSGWQSLNGEVDGPPIKSPTFLADDLGGLHGAIGALAALRHRERTGEGQHVDVALLDALLFQCNGSATLGALGVPLPRMASQFTVCAPTNIYACRDGHAMVGVLLDAHWKKLAETLGRPELREAPGYATNAERIANRDVVDAMLAEWCAPRTRAEIVETLAARGIPAAPVNSFAEAAAEPHVRERDMLQEVALADGTHVPLTGPSIKFARTPARVRTGAPALGAHTEEVLRECGVSQETLERLREAGVI